MTGWSLESNERKWEVVDWGPRPLGSCLMALQPNRVPTAEAERMRDRERHREREGKSKMEGMVPEPELPLGDVLDCWPYECFGWLSPTAQAPYSIPYITLFSRIEFNSFNHNVVKMKRVTLQISFAKTLHSYWHGLSPLPHEPFNW